MQNNNALAQTRNTQNELALVCTAYAESNTLNNYSDMLIICFQYDFCSSSVGSVCNNRTLSQKKGVMPASAER